MTKPTTLQKIDAALSENGVMTFNELLAAIWPDGEHQPRTTRRGGQAGPVIALSAALRRGGYLVRGNFMSGDRQVFPRITADQVPED